MSYSEPLINQIYRFLLAVGFGVIMGIVYEVLTVIKTLLGNGKRTVFFRDIVFSVLFTVLSFFFMLIYNEGEMRFNLIVAQLTGVISFHIAFGKRIISPVVAAQEKISKKLRKWKVKRN